MPAEPFLQRALWENIVELRLSEERHRKQLRAMAIAIVCLGIACVALFFLDAPWVSDQQREGARAFEDYIKRPENQRKVLQFGFRPGNPSVEVFRKQRSFQWHVGAADKRLADAFIRWLIAELG